MICAWCNQSFEGRRDARSCSRRCRQALFRARHLAELATLYDAPGRFAFADPPYPGMSYLYRAEKSYGGEVDHEALIAQLVGGQYLGWALATSEKALRQILPMCPLGARVCPWVKPHGVSSRSRGIHNAWEALIVVGGRQTPPGRRDWLRAMPARGGGELIGRKPVAYCMWLFGLLGMRPGDALDDLFPGTGIVRRCWDAVSSVGPNASPLPALDDLSPMEALDASPVDGPNASLLEALDTSRAAPNDG